MFRKSVFVLILLAAITACSTLPGPQIATPTHSPQVQPTITPTKVQSTQKPTTTPVQVSLDATIDQEHLSPLAPVSLHFNQPMDPASAKPALLTYPWVDGELRWEDGNATLKFTPTGGFTPARHYFLILSRDLKSAGGMSLRQPQQWRIQVDPAPRVVSHSPASTRLTDRQPLIRVAFDRKMDPESVRAALSVQPEIPFELEMEAENLTIRLGAPLEPGSRYNFTLAASAQDPQGIPMGDDYRWSYSLPELVSELSGPSLAYTFTKPSTQNLRLAFNYALDKQSFVAAVRVRTPDQDRVEGEWSWVKNQEAAFHPVEGYRFNTSYTIEFDGELLDADGLLFPLPEPLVYRMPPILAIWPAGADPAPPPEASIYIHFALPVDQAQVQEAFHIEPATEGTFQWDENSLRFVPKDLLQTDTTYTVTLGTAAMDAQGVPLLEEPFTWHFTTQTYYDVPRGGASFGDYGPNAQVLDFDGRRAIQFVTDGTVGDVQFELYRLSLEQFLDRYSSGFKGVAGYEQRPISLEGASLQAQWQVDISGRGAGYQGSVYEVLIPADVPAGLYILNMLTAESRSQLIVVLTRNTLVVKQVEGQLVAWISDINGSSVPGARVSVYARDGELVDQGRTDQDGVYRTRVGRDPQPLIVIAEDNQDLTGHDIEGTDITASGLSNEWLSAYGRWWGWWRPAPVSTKYAFYLQTDRPIYRPGQTVFFKLIARQDDDAQIGLLPEGTPLTLRVRDARDNVVQTYELATNDFGTAGGEFQLAEGAMLGDYNLEAVLDGENHRQVFKVQDYRKPDFQVAVTSDADQYVIGDPIRMDVDASYFFGQPVANASVTVQRYELRQSYYYGWDGSRAEQPEYIWYTTYAEPIKGRTGADGHYSLSTLRAEMGWDYDPGNYSYSNSLHESTFGIEVTLDDGSHQTVSAFTVYKVSTSPEKLAMESDSWVQNIEMPLDVRGSLTTLSGKPVSDRALRLELRQWDQSTNDYNTVVQSLGLMTDGSGQVSAQLDVQEPGSYQLRLSGMDSRGKEIYTNRWVYVYSIREGTWNSRYLQQINIAADRDSYVPGDVARLIIESSFSGPALLTFERGTTRRVQPVELTSPLTRVDIPIQVDDAPNIFVTVNAYQSQDTSLGPEMEDIYQNISDSRLRTASVELKVPVTGKSLQVSLVPDREGYAPREKATFHLRVTDEQNQPVVAEVSLALVDEAIFSLSQELFGPILESFYFERPNLVRTYDSMALTRELWMGGMGGGGGDSAATGPRADFPDTAFWLPALVTDQNGEATFSVDLPDSLTSWRLTAKAVSLDTQVGEAFINITTQQEIVVRPILPRVLTAGDQVSLSAMVHNYAAEPRDLTVSMIADPVDPTSSLLPLFVNDPISQSITLEPGEVRILGWTAQAVAAGDAALTVRALPSSGDPLQGDAVRLVLPVNPLAVADVTTQVGVFEGDFSTTLVVPEEVLDASTVRLELSRSIAGSLLTGLEYLTGYPYGCVEQTMSRALPNAVVGRAFHQLRAGNPTLQADLPPKINAGLQRLYGYQHNDGGWGWWFDDATNDYQTAWVVFGLSVTSQAGYEVYPQVIQRGAGWLKANLESMDVRTRAYALYSLAIAGYGDLEATRALAAQIMELDTFSQAGLALALSELGADAEAYQVLDVLAESAVQRDGYVYWPSEHEDGHYYEKTMASSVRSTALALDAFVRIRPSHPLEPGIVRWLMSQRHQDGWGSTNETSFTILALTDHLLTLEEATADTEYRVQLNGRFLEQGTLGRGEPAVSLLIPASELARGLNSLEVQQGGDGRLYYVINSRMLFPQAQIDSAGSIRIERSYQDPRSGKPLEQVTAGELVKVTLNVQFPDNGYFIIVEDKLPGGLEALNESLNTTSHEQQASQYEQQQTFFWQEYGYNNKEVHADRVSFFISELDAGNHTYTYLARATHAGTFAALPAEVSAMYDLSVWGRSASSILSVNPAP